jgi:uncharacterized MAPEG superfamily protein
VLGLLWCLGRILYALGYRAQKPGAREPGFMVAMLSTLALIVLAGIGIARAWMTEGAV